jgi:5-methylcytosine-specific restriction endonuclease McrA
MDARFAAKAGVTMDLISRDDAISKGLRRYFTGQPCAKRGHIAERMVDSYVCVACRKEMLDRLDAERGVVKWSKTDEERKARRKAALQRYAEKHPDRLRESQRKYKEKHPEKRAQTKANWIAKQTKEYFRLKSHKRRATAVGKISKGISKKLLELQKNKCAICKCNIKHKFEIDHVVPLVRGGPHEDANLQLLCPDCNRSKGAKDPVDYMQSKGYLI